MSALMCGRCPATAMPVKQQGMLTDPPGWACVTIAGQPVLNRLLCPACTSDVRELVALAPPTLEQRREHERERTYTRGYDDGQTDAQLSVAGEPAAS